MIKVISNLDAESLEKELNDQWASSELVAMYAINQKHFAWVKIKDEPKVEKKGRK